MVIGTPETISRHPPIKPTMTPDEFIGAIVARLKANPTHEVSKGAVVYSIKVLRPQSFRLQPDEFSDPDFVAGTTIPMGYLDASHIEQLNPKYIEAILQIYCAHAVQVEVKFSEADRQPWKWQMVTFK